MNAHGSGGSSRERDHARAGLTDFSKSDVRAGRSIWSYDKVQRAVGAVRRNRKAFARLPEKGEYLDVGCGSNVRPGFCGIDYRWVPGVDICWDITKGLPIPDNWIGGIFSEHCIEHIKIEHFYFVAEEFFRVLMPGSYLRLVVPSAEIYAQSYLDNISGKAAGMPYEPRINGDYTPAMSLNSIFLDWGHEFIYDFPTLALILGRAGFCEVERKQLGVGADSKLLIDTPFREIESLYLEARKPD